jgi:glycine cleavage system H protein
MASISEKGKSYHLIPQEERKCVWMTTGLISYKLCDRNFQCDLCPFDLAIKNEESREDDFQEADSDWTEGSPNGDSSVQINGSVFYHPDHCWVKVENPESVRMGLDDLLTQLIARVKVVILPQARSFAGLGECCAHIIQEDYILPVISPLSGTIQTVNSRLRKEPELIIGDSRGDGWLVTMKPENLESDLKNLLFGRKALSWYQRQEKEIIALTGMMLKHNPQAVGPTMQDGGVRIGCLQDMLNILNSRQRAKILEIFVGRSKNYRKLLSKSAG